MRDNLKDEAYFQEALNFTNECIAEFEMLTSQVAKTQGEDSLGSRNGYNALILYYTKKVNIEYSMGKDLNILREDYKKLLKYYSRMWDVEYGYIGLVRILSMGVMLSIETRCFDRLEAKILESGLDDYLLNFLLKVIDKKWRLCAKEFVFKDIYEPLRVIIEEPNNSKRIIEIKEYLEQQWYLIHKETAWFDSHKSKQNIYYGYWSYEAGAVAQILNLDDRELKNVQYYPYDLVHY